ncbi:hypothetical protein D3C86_357760 [compost metagenome]
MRTWRLFLWLILGLSLVAGMPEARAVLPPEVRFDQRLEERVPLELTFMDASGRALRLESVFGTRPVAIAMVQYDCPNLCTHVLNGLIKSLSEQRFDVGKALTVLVVSLDPHETPELAEVRRQLTLKRYGRAGTEDGWQFLTGDEASIRQLAEALGIHYSYDAKTQQYAHPAGITIATPQGRIARYLFGIEFPQRDLRLAVLEAAENRIGSPVDQVLMRCYRYDPQHGRYSLAVMEVLRLGGIATMLLLGGLIGGLGVAERRRRKAVGGGRQGGER